MWPFSSIQREVHYLTEAIGTLKEVARIDPNGEELLPDDLESVVDRFSGHLAFISGAVQWTFAAFDEYANRVANWALAQGFQRNDTLALFSRNRLEYVAVWYGLAKVGVRAALINDLLQGKSLAHCLEIAKSKLLLTEPELVPTCAAAQEHLSTPLPVWSFAGSSDGAQDFDSALRDMSPARPDRSLRQGLKARDTLLNMFTSGTTGLPKAVKVSHARARRYMRTFLVAMKSTPQDRMFMVLPMYHATGGLVGVGAALMRGGAVIVEPGFSARNFWDRVVESGATMFTYVGELCRILINTDPVAAENRHKIRAMVGNGLRPEVWTRFQDRFHVDRVVEFYGATEGNVGLMNSDGTIGAMGRIPWYVKRRFNLELVRHDFNTETPVRDADGHCIKVKTNEVGEAIGRIDPDDSRFLFEGYRSEEETAKKILRNVFKPDDMYFRTGDLMRQDHHAYYYFIDRIGDTFRWKSQNVATGEVASVLGEYPDVDMANVYGVKVPGHEGRAGMAAFVYRGKLDGESLFGYLHTHLPDYAQPVFLRLVKQPETTGTFKYKKSELVADGFALDRISDPLFVRDNATQSYIPLTPQFEAEILAGSARL